MFIVSKSVTLIEPHHEKTCLRGFSQVRHNWAVQPYEVARCNVLRFMK